MEGAMWDEGFMAHARTNTFQQEREEVYAAYSVQPAFTACWRNGKIAMCLSPNQKKWIFVDKKRDETKHRTEWCAVTGRYRCMKCRTGSKYMKMEGKCTGPKYLAKNSGRWGKRHMGGHDMKNGLAGRSCYLMQKMPRLCATANGTQIDEPLQAGEGGHER